MHLVYSFGLVDARIPMLGELVAQVIKSLNLEEEGKFGLWGSLYAENLRSSGITFPSIDLFFTGRGNVEAKGNECIAVLAGLRRGRADNPAFTSIQVFASKGSLNLEPFKRSVSNCNGAVPEIKLHELDVLHAEDVLDRVASVPEGSAVVIFDAALYTSDAVKVAPPEAGARFALSEDLWAPQLLHMVKSLEDINETLKSYILIEVGDGYPGRKDLQNSFMGIQTLAIVVSDHSEITNVTFAEKLAEWQKLLDEGRVGPALKSVQDLSEVFEKSKPYLRVQLLYRAGLIGKALDEAEALDIDSAAVDTILRIAKIAAEAGGLVISRQMLERCLPQLVSIPDYEVGMEVAQLLESDQLLDQIEAMYRTRYPGQATQQRRSIHRLINAGAYREALESTTNPSEAVASALVFCQTHLSVQGIPNYPEAARLLRGDESGAHLAFVWMVNDALRRQLIGYAFELVFGDFKPSKMETIGNHAFSVMRELLLSVQKGGVWPVADERVNKAFGRLISHVARCPGEPSGRFKLENLLSHKVAGQRGKAMLLYKVLHANQPKIAEKSSVSSTSFDDSAVETALCRLVERLGSEGVVVTGRLREPSDTFADGVADGILKVAEFGINALSAELITDERVKELLQWLTLVTMAAPHSATPDADLELYRRVAGRMSIAGRQQEARNLIDQILLSTDNAQPERLREAWLVCADIYSRLRQFHESLVCLSCGLSVECDVDLPSAVREADLSCRLLRDLHAFEIAWFYHERSGMLLRQLGVYDSQALLHEFVGFGIEFGQIMQRGDIDRETLENLLIRMHGNALKVLERRENPVPMAVLFGQVILVAYEEGIPVPADIVQTRDLLGAKLDGREADLFRQVATPKATGSGLLVLHRASGPARYARDMAFDASDTAVAARRLLAHKELSASECVLALELLCDRAVALPGWQSLARSVHPISSLAELEGWLIDLSRRNIDVVMIGLDERQRLHAILARDGRIAEQRSRDIDFDQEGLLQWAKHYPYRYGVDEKTPNLFKVSTEGFDFPFKPVKATAIIATNQLQILPPTLYRIGEKCLGEDHPVFAAPSLSWLYAASSSPPSTDKRISGWISVAEQNGYTLAMVRDRLDEMISRYQVVMDTGAGLPDGLWGAELSFVVAHGSVLPEGRFFQRVSDEGILKVTTDDFARAFKNVGVAILFICSAGRSDHSPEGESNYGLARELLAQGCSAVIASPWPIDPRVTYHWLPAFMAAWDGGKNVTDATFIANQHVKSEWNSELRNCMAMTVFGDGLRMKSKWLAGGG